MPTTFKKTSSRGAGKRDGKPALGRDAWIAAGKKLLIREGIAAVEIGRLARVLRVTRGGFYWFFSSRLQLLNELLRDWEHNNSAPFLQAIRPVGENGVAQWNAIVDIWIGERDYSSAWDSAVRDWARVSEKAAAAVHRVDFQRIDVLRRILVDLGFEGEDAEVRARIVYYHQVGYYTLNLREDAAERARLLPYYNNVFLSKPLRTLPGRS